MSKHDATARPHHYSLIAKFPLGRLVATPGALETLGELALVRLYQRHAQCDWGELSPEDRGANTRALRYGGRLFSSYQIGDARVWIITESDRSATTALLPHEY